MMLLPTLGVWYVSLFTFLFVGAALITMLVILIQKPRGGGLAGAFGGAGGSSQSVFGAKTGDVLTWVTVICFTLFIILAMLLTWFARPADGVTPTAPNAAATGDLGDTPTGTSGTPAGSSGTPSTDGTDAGDAGAGTGDAGGSADSDAADTNKATGTDKATDADKDADKDKADADKATDTGGTGEAGK